MSVRRLALMIMTIEHYRRLARVPAISASATMHKSGNRLMSANGCPSSGPSAVDSERRPSSLRAAMMRGSEVVECAEVYVIDSRSI